MKRGDVTIKRGLLHIFSTHSFVQFLFALLFITFVPLTVNAEDKGNKEYWISKYGEVKESTLSIRAREVFDRLLSASDRRVGIEPSLYIVKYEGVPWAQSLADGSIIISKKGLDFCYENQSTELGDARLAFVFGHELAHQFNGDFWHYKLLRTAEDDKESTQAFQDIKELAKKPEMFLAKEIRADQYGIIYATLAGYNSDEIVSKDKNFFLEWAEKENSNLNSRKDLLLLSEKRSKAVLLKLKEVSDKITLFQLGVISYHIGRYDDALSLFIRFTSYFPGREVYSNIGTIYLRLAYEKFLSSRNIESFPFLITFGIDVETRAETIDIARSFTEDNHKEYKKFVNIAVENLKKAIQYDPFYQIAKNSLGCAYILGSRYYDAISIFEEVLKSEPNNRRVQNNLAVAYIVLGQGIGSQDLINKAKKLLMNIKDEDYTAKSNLNALQLIEKRSNEIPLSTDTVEELSYNFITIDFESDYGLKPGMDESHETFLSIVEEILTLKKEVIRVSMVPNKDIFLLLKSGDIRLILYKELSDLKVSTNESEKPGIYISKKNRKGVVVTRNKYQDYFEF